MVRRDNQHSQQGFLLVEAILSAVVIGVGLVFISRGLAGQLKALQAVEEYDALLSLAQAKLVELEAERLLHAASASPTEGTFEASQQTLRCQAPHWKIAAEQREGEETDSPPSDITLTVWCKEGSSASLTLSAIWPTELVPASWF